MWEELDLAIKGKELSKSHVKQPWRWQLWVPTQAYYCILQLILKTDETCELIGKCQLSQSLYKEEGTGFIPAVDKAMKEWFSRLQLPSAAMPVCLESASLQEWKKVKRIDSEAGDLMHAGAHCSGRDSRDSVYIRVGLLILLPIHLFLTHSHLVWGAWHQWLNSDPLWEITAHPHYCFIWQLQKPPAFRTNWLYLCIHPQMWSQARWSTACWSWYPLLFKGEGIIWCHWYNWGPVSGWTG